MLNAWKLSLQTTETQHDEVGDIGDLQDSFPYQPFPAPPFYRVQHVQLDSHDQSSITQQCKKKHRQQASTLGGGHEECRKEARMSVCTEDDKHRHARIEGLINEINALISSCNLS